MPCAGCSLTGRTCCSSTRPNRPGASAARPTGSSVRTTTSAHASTLPTASWRRSSRSGSTRSTARARRARSPRRCSTSFDSVPEQDEAKRLLRAALNEGPAHAYLFHGPAGVGKRAAAVAFASELLGNDPRVGRRSHPDLYVLEPLGDQIRIDAVREMRRDLHMRPFEAQRRVYLIFGAHLLNDEAADALLKDLEEPPEYAVIVLVADEVGPLPETIRSRCQSIPFRRLSERAVREQVRALAPELTEEQVTSIARVASGRLDRAERLLDPAAARRRDALLEIARSVYGPAFDPRAAAETLIEASKERAAEAKEREEAAIEEPAVPPAGRSARSCSHRWRSSPRGTATSSRRRQARTRRSSTSTAQTSCARTGRWSGSRAPSVPRSSCARRGGASRSSSSRRPSRSRRCSSSCGAPSRASWSHRELFARLRAIVDVTDADAIRASLGEPEMLAVLF